MRVVLLHALLLAMASSEAFAFGSLSANLNKISLYGNPQVVTNVSFEGLASEEAVSHAASSVSNYVDSSIGGIPEADFSASNSVLVSTIKEVSPAPGNYETVSNMAMTAIQEHQSLQPATNYVNSVSATKQDRLPYPTNAIPYTSISGTPSLSGYATRSEVHSVAVDATNYVDEAISMIPPEDFSTSNQQLVATIRETAPPPGNYDTVSNKAMTALQSHQSLQPATNYANSVGSDVANAATNYTDTVIGQIPAPDFSTANQELKETIIATAPPPGDYETVSNKAMTALQSHQSLQPATNYANAVGAAVANAATNYANAVRDLKQDRLPYPTNAIPYAAISGTPSLSGYATHDEVHSAASAATNYVDAKVGSIPDPDFSTANAQLVATIEATAPPPGNYATVSNRAMTALQEHQSLQPATNYANAVGEIVANAATNYTDAAISTNNPAFVNAVTNCPVDPTALGGADLGDFGGYATLGSLLVALASAIVLIRATKAEKVQNAIAGNFAGLDANGNITDSGKSASDFAPSSDIPASALSSAVQTSLGKADTAVQPASLSGKEDVSNKVTSLSAQSTDTQYPSAKCMYDIEGDIESVLASINGSNIAPDLSEFARLASPNFTGIPTAPTAASGTSTTQIATTAFVSNAIGDINTILDAINGEVV